VSPLGLSIISAALVSIAPSSVLAEGPDIALEIGMEADSNPERVEGASPLSDLVGRYFLRVDDLGVAGRSQDLSVRYRSGGKLYQSFEEENALINQMDGRWRLYPFATSGVRWGWAEVRGSVKDRTERGHRRDYQRGRASGGIGLALGPVRLSALGGAGRFVYKPDRRLSNDGPIVEGRLVWRLSDTWVTQVSLSRVWRDYRTARLVPIEEASTLDQDAIRSDRALVGSAGVSYRGPVIVDVVGTWYENESNSYGQSLERLGASLTVTSPIWGGVIGSARVGLQRTSYSDVIFLDETLAVDEDNRNSVVLELERGLFGGVGMVLRYSLYAQEFGTRDTDYARQLLFLGLSVEPSL
jgi:hypothetical protein